MLYLQYKMAVKVTKKVKYAMALYQKINVTRSTLCMESLIKCTTFALCHSKRGFKTQILGAMYC